MEQSTQQRLDSILEDEVKRGYRVKAVPEDIQALLLANGGPAIERVRLTRLNPARRRKIAEVVQRQYHKDLQNPDILSREQIVALVRHRGEWTEAMEQEMKDLQEKTNREMGELFMDGIARDDWTAELLQASQRYREKIEELVPAEQQAEVQERFTRWLEYSSDRREEYNELHAKAQGRETYSVDVDYQRLTMAAGDVEAVSQLDKIEDLRDKLQRFIRLQRDRLRLMELQGRNVKIFAECVEQRRDTAEEMARLYFTAESVDAQDTPKGPLCASFEALWDWPEEVIQWFLVETYFFHNGIPDEAREYLQTFGFLKADGQAETIPSPSGESGPSDESPDPQSSKPDSSAVSTERVSSEYRPDMISTTAS